MEILVIDLSKNINHPDRRKMVPLTKDEIEERNKIRDDDIVSKQEEEARREKMNNLVDGIAAKLNMDRDELSELFGVPKTLMDGDDI